MSRQIAALAAVFLITASASDAQTPYGYSNQALQLCGPAQKDYSKKQAELVKVQTRIANLTGAIAVLRDGITQQQEIASAGKLHAGMAGTFGMAKVTKAMSDTFLNITAPAAPQVKKAYDALDSIISASYALAEGKGTQASAGGFEAVQNAGDAYDEYLKRQKGMVIRPEKMETPGVVSSMYRGAYELRRGDYAGTASNLLTGVEKLTESNAKGTKLALRAGSKAAAMLADTPGKTDESRFADGLGALSEVSKLAARAAQDRRAYAVAGMAGRAGRVLDQSGMMLEQVGNAKQGLADTAAMVDEYNVIDERSTSTQKAIQRQIDSKLEEIGRLREQERQLHAAVNRVAPSAQSCQQHASEQAVGATNASSTPAARTPYTWNRAASRERLERAKQVRDNAEASKAVTTPQDSITGPRFVWEFVPQPAYQENRTESAVTHSRSEPNCYSCGSR